MEESLWPHYATMSFPLEPWAYVLIAAVALSLAFLVAAMIFGKRRTLNGKHVLITGGSAGIGLAMAVEAAKRGADVTIVARNERKLQEAKGQIESARKNADKQRVRTVRADVAAADTSSLDSALAAATDELGPAYLLVNNAGTSIPRRFLEADPSEARFMMDLNYHGSLNVTRALLPAMQRAGDGVVLFVSSQAGFLGIYGLATYSGSKYAVRGFAEALAMETRPFGVDVTVCCPPDTDTPGFEEEMKTKPEECKIISGSGSPMSAETIAK